jgi:2-dehydro-3-deoxy-D-gluconate 5-dehydrogenase
MPALTIRDDIGSEELRRQARRESDGRISARLIAIANTLEGMDRASAARLAGMVPGGSGSPGGRSFQSALSNAIIGRRSPASGSVKFLPADAWRLPMTLFDLNGRVAIVTGGNGGIGLGMARGLAAAGANVVVAARNAEKAETAIKALGDKSAFIALDVADEGSSRALIAQTAERFGRLDILVNNAGTSIRKPPENYTAEEWHTVLDTNLTGAFLCSQAAHPVMKRGGGGKIINIGSMFALFGSAYAAPYAASKGALVQLTKSLAAAWAADNIQVNAILPGWIDTELTRDARQQVPGLHERVLARTPAGRWGVPEDLSGIAIFLAAPASDFITGAAIPVDGGFSAMG